MKIPFDIVNYIDFKETKNKFIIYYGTGYGVGATC